MHLDKKDMDLVLSGLKAISNDSNYTVDLKRRAKELEDRIGSHYAKGCDISVSPNIKNSERK
jgi:hypothetical protein